MTRSDTLVRRQFLKAGIIVAGAPFYPEALFDGRAAADEKADTPIGPRKLVKGLDGMRRWDGVPPKPECPAATGSPLFRPWRPRGRLPFLACSGPPHSARTALLPIRFGHIDMRAHTEILSALRPDTPE